MCLSQILEPVFEILKKHFPDSVEYWVNERDDPRVAFVQVNPLGYGGPGINGVGVGEGDRERGEREARERQEVTSPSPSTRPDTRLCWGVWSSRLP